MIKAKKLSVNQRWWFKLLTIFSFLYVSTRTSLLIFLSNPFIYFDHTKLHPEHLWTSWTHLFIDALVFLKLYTMLSLTLFIIHSHSRRFSRIMLSVWISKKGGEVSTDRRVYLLSLTFNFSIHLCKFRYISLTIHEYLLVSPTKIDLGSRHLLSNIES